MSIKQPRIEMSDSLRKRIKDWAKENGIKLPKAYNLLLSMAIEQVEDEQVEIVVNKRRGGETGC